MARTIKPAFFPESSDFRKWLQSHHKREPEIWVGYYKKGTGLPSISWPESVDQALCFGWIDGIRKGIDDVSYMIRFTPRKTVSHWSAVNIKRVKALTKTNLMKPSGLEAFGRRRKEKSAKASYEQDKVKLDRVYEKMLKANKKAWSYFKSTPPSYQKPCTWWVMSAKRESTRLRRLNVLISSSEKKETIPPLRWSKG